MKLLNKYVLTENEIDLKGNEIGLVILDNKGRLLVEKDQGMINIPLVKLTTNSKADKVLKDTYKSIFDSDISYFSELYKLKSYRYRYRQIKNSEYNQKVDIKYYYIITNKLPVKSNYKFLTLNHIKSILDSHDYPEYIVDEFDILLDELKSLYKESILLNDFNSDDYTEHLTNSFLTNIKEDSLKKKYPFIDIDFIIASTLHFIKNINEFSNVKDQNHWIVSLDQIYPIKEFSKKLWYSDIIYKISKGNSEYFVSNYLINSYLNECKVYLNDNEYEVDDTGYVKGLPELIIYSDNKKAQEKVKDFEKIKKLNYSTNDFRKRRY